MEIFDLQLFKQWKWVGDLLKVMDYVSWRKVVWGK